MKDIITLATAPRFRTWAYGLMTAVMTYLTVRGVIDGDSAAALNAIGAAFFAIAGANVNHGAAPVEYQPRHEAE